MGNKGKGKAAAAPPAPAAAASASTSKKSAKTTAGAPKKPADDDFIVFTNSTKDKPKNKRGGGQGSAAADQDEPGALGPPKPTVKQIIGGASWTGKLPVNLLSEHCQKQKWNRPDYQPIRGSEGFSYFVSFSSKNPKTQETQKLPPFKIPPDHKHLVTMPTELEGRHAAATYALFRVCSMKNIHTTLPPVYKALWKEFEALKKEDVKRGLGWMYDADPFATMKQREDEKAAAEKKRKEQEAIKEKAKNMPGAAGLVLRSNAAVAGGGGANLMKGWTSVPKIEMGRKTRSQLEDLLRREVIWNPRGVKMSKDQKDRIAKELTGSGFRRSHVEEAVDECKDREETLEWLLIHVPEDDLPRWAMPENYSAGVSVANTSDLKREAAIKRLSESGYSVELCRKTYEECDGNEARTAEALQHFLVSSGDGAEPPKIDEDAILTLDEPEDLWKDEMSSLSSVFGDHFKQLSEDLCQIRVDSVKNGGKTVETFAQFRRSSRYPFEIVVTLVSELPSYIRLSVIKKTLSYISQDLPEEPMKIFFAVDWIQQNINDIIEAPGKLRDISGAASTASELRVSHGRKQTARHPKPIAWIEDQRSKQEWQKRQQSPQYKDMLAQRAKLPAWQVRDVVVNTVAQNQITIIAGETGSGKSTQSVQFVLDDLYSKGYGNAANIICTQPRRISALGLADRVSDERCSQVGKEVGYTIRGENKTSAQTKITFVTTGVLLRRLQTSGGRTEDVVASLADVSHVVIDEVHERSLDTDFLLSIIRDVLKRRKDLKLILMSATLDAATFKNYFTSEGLGVGMVEISGRTYPVEDFYLDDIIQMTNFQPRNDRYDRYRDDDFVEESASKSSQDPINKIIQKLGSRINYSLILETAKEIDQDLYHYSKKGGILIFLPGVAEINRACNELRNVSSFHVLPLHASLETREQRRVFVPAPSGKRKIVVATNVAETSITIDDIVAVIDTGRVKETSFDPQNNMRKLEETWASRAACKQRRGRAGRVQAGKCYKLYTRNLEQQMPERPDPEIRRVPLEQLCLSVRAMGTADVGGFLRRTPTPPETAAIEGALKMLRKMGAMDGEDLTSLGQQLAMIPADLRCGKLMVYGAIFGCLEEAVTIAAMLSTKSPFVSPAEKREEARQARARYARGDGDLLTDLRAVQEWDSMMDQRMPQSQVRNYCSDNFLNYQVLSDIAATRAQYYSALAEIGIVLPSSPSGGDGRAGAGNHKSRSGTSTPQSSGLSATTTASMALVRAVTAAAFTPQIARIQFPDKKFASSVSGAVELDPEAKTIKYFTQENGRVFIHPSSTLFDNQGFSGNAAFVSYFTMIATSKIFVRDLTPFNAFTLLLFAGSIELDTMGRGLVVDDWLRLRGWARIGVLVSRLRGMVDNTIAMKVANPQMDTRESEVIRLVTKLIELDGLDA
ncbi:P-loop containing nucleoside triphosphate hydrolase protein [Microdochium trichocladiopsis]|uniref:P-loop containing nucleoside triphosphate hydrolase protein n=1 Tax=Microdochium trichocladiopsis TaxID=1682393 RepID=A0A9P9BRR7_9PEZI|nr:P-loop containing nucleoside triphosphate hydrolase protein [Microdochium trichocladiopsis]KAH7033221.1 P-loop containing nucleoside triphosphate hydrolase protein [Microdochium trichocladiopsis]